MRPDSPSRRLGRFPKSSKGRSWSRSRCRGFFRCLCLCLSSERPRTSESTKESSTGSSSFRTRRVPIVLSPSFPARSPEQTSGRCRSRGGVGSGSRSSSRSGRSRGRTKETGFGRGSEQVAGRLSRGSGRGGACCRLSTKETGRRSGGSGFSTEESSPSCTRSKQSTRRSRGRRPGRWRTKETLSRCSSSSWGLRSRGRASKSTKERRFRRSCRRCTPSPTRRLSSEPGEPAKRPRRSWGSSSEQTR
jgi:hypothetical protein